MLCRVIAKNKWMIMTNVWKKIKVITINVFWKNKKIEQQLGYKIL